MKNKILIILIFVASIFFLPACVSQQSVYPPEDCLKIDFEREYPLDEDVKVNIAIGLRKGYQDIFGNIEGFKYVLSYSKNDTISNEADITELLTITDFSSDLYCYTKTEEKINFNYCKQFIISKEMFNDGDHFYIFLFSTALNEQESFSIKYKIRYEKINDYLTLNLSD